MRQENNAHFGTIIGNFNAKVIKEIKRGREREREREREPQSNTFWPREE